MPTNKDSEQDELIRRNAEAIRRNEDAIRRQTEALEKIRDHYFPKTTVWKRTCGYFLKFVGAVTIATGVMETLEWYWNTRLTDNMAEECADVAKRLFFKENDAVGAAEFIDKAVELDSGTVRYRIARAYVKGIVAISELTDLGRPLTTEERTRVDAILAEAVFLQEVAPTEAMPHVLAAQAYGLRGEHEAAMRAAARAIELEPENVQARVTACARHYLAGDTKGARRQLAEADRLNPNFPLVRYMKAFFLLEIDRDSKGALAHVEELLRRSPRFAAAYYLKGRITLEEQPAAARQALEQALVYEPDMALAMVLIGETYEREGNLTVARLWLNRALDVDARNMKALMARARIAAKKGDAKAACEDLTAAIALAPFRADLYRERSKMRQAAGDASGAAEDVTASEELSKVGGKAAIGQH